MCTCTTHLTSIPSISYLLLSLLGDTKASRNFRLWARIIGRKPCLDTVVGPIISFMDPLTLYTATHSKIVSLDLSQIVSQPRCSQFVLKSKLSLTSFPEIRPRALGKKIHFFLHVGSVRSSELEEKH